MLPSKSLYGHASDLRVNKKDGEKDVAILEWKKGCDVCNTEKLQILRHMGPGCVNQRSELNNKSSKKLAVQFP